MSIEENSLLKIIDSVIERTTVPSDIKIERFGDDIKVHCDSTLLEVVFINLIKNAIEAMNNMGTIKIRLVDQVDKVMIEVENDGDNIPDDMLQTIFDPLFSTKETVS